ncbi:DUF2231 domain-containing protein [Gloeobacter violaceus]|uniref:Glr0737 protein n=1 Tax=Gloeobacter violaceus (strain ATCC 29082 / PCC 7421) TaxID=251221 RepID=Q7NMM8_GLOVI|nr:DUF2231 domain-containing protein [Gloeobacter violaceus]BAC88678.1 glr0737 [Gloeobacter violaceus PCC 7421]
MFDIKLNEYGLPYPEIIGSAIHPIIVHFVIATVIASVLFDFIGYFGRKPSFHNVGWYNLVVACAAVIGAIIFGQIEAGLAHQSNAMQPVLAWHTIIGWSLGALILIMAAWRGVARYRDPNRLNPAYLGLSLLVVGTVFYQVFLGTQLVWTYGIHVKPVVEATTARTQP